MQKFKIVLPGLFYLLFSSIQCFAVDTVNGGGEDPQELFKTLRSMALSAKATDFIDIANTDGQGVYGVVMEMGLSERIITLAAFVTGDASLYFSSGGGVIGGAGHETIRKAAIDFNRKADRFVASCKKTTSFPMPASGQVIFYILTKDGIYTAEAQEKDLRDTKSLFSPLFYEGHKVITECRIVEEKQNSKMK